MKIAPPPGDCIASIRCPAVKGLAAEVVVILHKSLVQLVLMRTGLEMTAVHLNRSREAVCESEELLKRLRADGF